MSRVRVRVSVELGLGELTHIGATLNHQSRAFVKKKKKKNTVPPHGILCAVLDNFTLPLCMVQEVK